MGTGQALVLRGVKREQGEKTVMGFGPQQVAANVFPEGGFGHLTLNLYYIVYDLTTRKTITLAD